LALGPRFRSGHIDLFVTVVLAGLSAPLIKWLILHGGKLGLSRPGAISFCNVLFVGNFCAGLVILAASKWNDIKLDLVKSRPRTRALLTGAILVGGVIAPTVLYYALGSTTATNLLLLTRIESLAFTAVGFLFFKDLVTPMNWLGLSVILVGSLLLALLSGGGAITFGDGMALLGGILFAIGSVMTRFVLQDLKVATLLFSRNLIGAVVFFWIALYFYGPHHFADAFAAELWVIMLVYAAAVVVLGQITWFRALKKIPQSTVAVFITLIPVVGILFAYLLLEEVPSGKQWIGSIIILAGVGISQIAGRPRQSDRQPSVDRCLSG
jgi:drug/metabolite transporter (DMT)-like permease